MKTLDWLREHELPTGGIAAYPGAAAYPECTGYLLPTLYHYGETALATRCADWLLSIQREDGSYPGLDYQVSRAFDTAAIVEGLRAAAANTGNAAYWQAANRAEAWIKTQVLPHGLTRVHQFADETRLYLLRADALIGNTRAAQYWMRQGEWIPERTHYIAYALEGLLNMGYADWVRERVGLLLQTANERGLLPYSLRSWYEGEGTDTTATCQVAVLAMRLDLNPVHLIHGARRMVRPDGGVSNNETERTPISWAAKFYLDMEAQA